MHSAESKSNIRNIILFGILIDGFRLNKKGGQVYGVISNFVNK